VVLVYGHSATPNDKHIYDAIWSSDVKQVYVAVHNPKDNLDAVRGALGPYMANHTKKVLFLDSSDLNVWGSNAPAKTSA
jgi:hypothetical protein